MRPGVEINKWALWELTGYKPHPSQIPFHTSEARYRTAACGRRFGKALALDTPVPTPNGWSTMGALRPGDFVIDDQGQPTRVVRAHEILRDRPCYEVVFSDGSRFVADAEHLWVTSDRATRRSGRDRRLPREPQARTTKEIAETLTVTARKDFNHTVALAGALDLPEITLPIDPYVLGLWLGDGASAGASFTTNDPEILLAFTQAGYSVVKRNNTPYSYGIRGGLHVALRELGLQHNKHVPAIYLRASQAQRRALLQGLMDTDGTVDSDGNCEFTSTKKVLAEAVFELLCSLGERPTIKEGRATLYGKDCGPKYRVHFTAISKVFRLQRKVAKLNVGTKFVKHRTIVAVNQVPSVPVRCIEVEAESAQFLIGRAFIPTHNSRMAAAEIEPLLFQVHPDGSGTRSWIIGPTYKTGAKEFEYVWNDIILGVCKGLRGIRKAFNARTGEMYIEMPWGSRVEVKSADHPDGLVSEGLDYALFAEAAKHDPKVWTKYIRPALADWHGKATFPSTPEGLNWFEGVYKNGLPESEDCIVNGGSYESFHFPSWANPIVYPGGLADPEIQEQIKDKPAADVQIGTEAWWEYVYAAPSNAWFLQEIAAEFRSFVGQVYPEWNDELNIYENFYGRDYEFQPAWPNYLFQDYGFTNPMVALDVQTGPDDTIYIWREYYQREKPTHTHAQEIAARVNPEGYRLDAGFGDAADPASVETMSRLVVPTQAEGTSKDWTEGVALVKEFLAPIELEIPVTLPGGVVVTRRARLFVSKNCPNTIWEFNNYRIKKTARDEENAREEPHKWADHALDAIRYGLMHLFKLGARYHLSDVMEADDFREQTSLDLDDSFSSAEGSFFSTGASSIFTLG